MATIDNILGKPSEPRRVGAVASPIPPIDSSLAGAPATVAGSGSAPVQVSQQKQPQSPTQESAEQTKMSYVDLFKAMNPYKPETAEERAKREKREKGEKIIAAVGDGISALSNLYFTSRYAPNAYNPTQGMSVKAKDRWDKLKAEREANQQAYYNGYLKALAMDDADDKDERNWRYRLDRDRIADERNAANDRRADAREKRADDKAAMDAQLAEVKLALQAGKLDYQGYQNEIARIKADYEPRLMESTINKNNRVGTSTRSSGGSGKPGEYPWYDADGNLHYAHTYEAMRQNSINAGTWEEATQKSVSVKTSPDLLKGTKETKTVKTAPAKGSSKKPAKKPEKKEASSGKGKGYGSNNSNTNKGKGKGYGS